MRVGNLIAIVIGTVGGGSILAWAVRRKSVRILSGIRSPIDGGQVTSGWGSPREYRNGIHRGIDIPMPKGTPVLAFAAGTIRKLQPAVAQWAGRYVEIDHPALGLISRYLHLDDLADLTVGDAVEAGQQIGTVGDTGCSTYHLHFEVCATDLDAYRRVYGDPADGFPAARIISGCTPVPAEPLVPIAWSAKALAAAETFGLTPRTT